MTVSEIVRMQQAETRSKHRGRYTPLDAAKLCIKQESRLALGGSLFMACVDAVLDAIDLRDSIDEVNMIAPGLIEA